MGYLEGGSLAPKDIFWADRMAEFYKTWEAEQRQKCELPWQRVSRGLIVSTGQHQQPHSPLWSKVCGTAAKRPR